MAGFTWDHIHLRTPDPEATAQWFERMFGAEIIRSTQQGKPRIDIRLGGAMIFTAQVTPGDGVNPAPVTPYQGLDHFGLAVSGIDAIASRSSATVGSVTPGPESRARNSGESVATLLPTLICAGSRLRPLRRCLLVAMAAACITPLTSPLPLAYRRPSALRRRREPSRYSGQRSTRQAPRSR